MLLIGQNAGRVEAVLLALLPLISETESSEVQMLPLLFFLAAVVADDAPEAVPVHDGGVCAGLSWVRLAPGERAFIERGPDFNVFSFEGPGGSTDHWWGVYSGNAAQVRGNGPVLLQRDGVTVRRASEDGKFRGYIAERKGWQNHFFGSTFKGTPGDKSFFDRIDFSTKGQALCAKDR
jgi:hypothetical protein